MHIYTHVYICVCMYFTSSQIGLRTFAWVLMLLINRILILIFSYICNLSVSMTSPLFWPSVEPVTKPYQLIFSDIFYFIIPIYLFIHLGPSPLYFISRLPKLPPIALFPLFLGHGAIILSLSFFMITWTISLMNRECSVNGCNMYHL